jgi:excisionase family DNA binding protein
MQQYYTLDEAARVLQTTPDKLKEMAKRKEIRSFQDRGTLRFRAQEIHELARAQGLGSDAELQLGEAARGKPATPKPSRRGEVEDEPVVLDFSPDEVPLGDAPRSAGRSGGPRSGGPKSSGPKLGGPKSGGPKSGPRSPTPQPAGDSDVRLVLDGGLDFQIDLDSDVKVPPSGGPKSPGPKSPGPKSPGRKSRVAPPEPADSGVRIIPLEQPNDSDVKVTPRGPQDSTVPLGGPGGKTPSDSDIRLEDLPRSGGRGEDALVTEEIDLDAEALKAAEEAAKPKPRSKFRSTGSSGNSPALPTSSPFELSEHDLEVEGAPAQPPKGKGEGGAEEKEADTDSSSDFDLTPYDASQSPLELGSDEVPLLADDEEVTLGELTGPGAGSSGINLDAPLDSGISLEEEEGSDEIDLDLSLEVPSGVSGADPATTPRPGQASSGTGSSSEFEVTLDDEGMSPTEGTEEEGSSSEFELTLDAEGDEAELALGPAAKDEGSSEFELTLDVPDEGAAAAESDSEFELTLDAEGELAAAGEDEAKDIFEETNFDVPALDDESASEAVALEEGDTDLESSDFDLSLDEGEAESGSQVVALEEEADDAAETVARPRTKAKVKAKPRAVVAEDEAELDIDLDAEAEAEPGEEEEREPVAAAAAPPAEWGPLPALLLFPTVIVLFVVGLMSFELVQGMWGYNRPTKVSKPVIENVAGMFTELPKD